MGQSAGEAALDVEELDAARLLKDFFELLAIDHFKRGPCTGSGNGRNYLPNSVFYK
jgi:hypothetical protein